MVLFHVQGPVWEMGMVYKPPMFVIYFPKLHQIFGAICNGNRMLSCRVGRISSDMWEESWECHGSKNGVLNSLIVLSPIAGQSRGLSPLNELQCLLFPREQEMVRRSDCDFHVWNHLSCLHSAQECCHLPGLFLLPQ